MKDWAAPEDCTLPIAERPLRVSEFDELFSKALRCERPHPTRLDLVVPRDIEATARGLARRESECCSFFTFGFDRNGENVIMHIGVPPAQIEILDAIEARIVR